MLYFPSRESKKSFMLLNMVSIVIFSNAALILTLPTNIDLWSASIFSSSVGKLEATKNLRIKSEFPGGIT